MRGFAGDRPVGLTDIKAQVPELYKYVFKPSANGTIAGFYVDIDGNQIGADWSEAITAGTIFTFSSLTNTMPPTAVGWQGSITSDCYVNRSGKTSAPFYDSVPSAYLLLASDTLVFGRING